MSRQVESRREGGRHSAYSSAAYSSAYEVSDGRGSPTPCWTSLSHDRRAPNRARRCTYRWAQAGLRRVSALSVLAVGVVLAVIVLAIFADQVAPYDPLTGDYSVVRQPPPSHVFGTDDVGRDVLSRLIYGARTSLAVGFGSVLIGDLAGLIWGIASGYIGRRFDLLSQRLLEVVLAFPG